MVYQCINRTNKTKIKKNTILSKTNLTRRPLLHKKIKHILKCFRE